jgi:murein DD-endopeptidase MepM/ murein hydrolase activator NlpD
MTSSFGISPQRQLRDLAAGPRQEAAPARPAEPASTPRQVGGQLMYGASYQPNRAAAESIESIQQFLSKEGAFGKASASLFEDYKEQKRQEATRLLQQEASAIRDSLENANETRIISKTGNENLAKQNRLSNPWVNFFYYDTKASNAGKEVGIGLASWGKQQSERIAEIDNPAERAAIIAAKVDDLLKPYSDIPAAFKAAKIDPIVSNVLLDVKKDITNKTFERAELTDQRVTSDKFLGNIRLGAQFVRGAYGTEAGTVFGERSLQNGYNEAYNYYVVTRGYSEKAFHDILFREAPNLFVDANKDGYNDLGETFSYLNYVKAWQGIKTADGQAILDLRNAKGETFRQALENGAVQAVKAQEVFEGSVERGIQRAQRQWKRNFNDDTNQFYAQNPNPTDDQITSQREALKARNRQLAAQGLLPEGMSVADADDLVDKTFPFRNKDISPEQEARLKEEVEDLAAQGVTDIPGDLAARIEGTSVMAFAINKFGNARREAANPETNQTRNSILKQLTDGLKGSFMSADPQLKGIAVEGKVGEQKKSFLNQAVIEAKQRLNVEGSRYINNKIYEAKARGENIKDPAVQLRILEDAKRYFYERPEYNDVDSYYNISDPGRLGAKNTRGPVLGVSSKDAQGRWRITVNDADNRATWSAVAQRTFNNNPQAARQYLSNNFVFNEKELNEINNALATGNTNALSSSTRQSIANIQRGFGNKLTVAEIVQKQADRYFDGQVPPVFRQNAQKLQAAVKAPVAGTGTAPRDTLLYVYNFQHAHSDNRAVDFQIERGNRAQTANPLPAPFSGRVIYAGFVEGYGNTVVIEAETNGPGYRKDDRLLLGHAARLTVKQGQRINRGQTILIAGDQSPMNSNPGRSGTGDGTPGHLHSQLYQPGQGFPGKAAQYGQETQNDFFRKAFYPLFRNVSDPNRR